VDDELQREFGNFSRGVATHSRFLRITAITTRQLTRHDVAFSPRKNEMVIGRYPSSLKVRNSPSIDLLHLHT
jgi:hypothetical protein